MSKKLKFIASLVALLFCLTGIAFGQETAGAIEGTIKDPAGNVVPGVTVTVTSVGTSSGARQDATVGFTRSATTDDSGFFRVLQVPSGFFNVSAAATSGFGSATVENIEVVLGKTTPVNFSLGASGVSGNVTITASDVTSIDPTDSKIQTNITTQTAELLPKGVNFTSLLTVAPAVRNEPLTGGFQIDGASGSENTFIIDGQDVSNFRTGQLNGNNNIPFQFVQEVQVKSSGFEAEFGGATGGVINVVTKGGSNDYHGEFGISFEPSNLQAGPRRFLFNRTAAQGGPFLFTPRKDDGTNEYPSGTFSGPILKDRIFFLASYSPQFRNTNRSLEFRSPITGVLGGAGDFRSHQRNDYSYVRIDANVRQNLRFTGTYTYNPISLRGILPTFASGLSSTVPSTNFGGTTGVVSGADYLNNRGGRQNSQNVNGLITWTPTSRLVVTARGGYSYLNEKLDSYGVPPVLGLTRVICDASSTGIPASAGCTAGTQNTPSLQQLLFDASRRRTFDADASYFLSNFGGRHQFKGGYQFNGISNDVRNQTVDTVVLYYGTSIADVAGVDPATLPSTAGSIGAGLLQRFSRQGNAGSNNNAIYIQDSYQPFSRLSINVGVRAERENVPSFVVGKPSIKFGFGDKVAPRFGLAFDVTGNGKTKIFFSYGQFLDRFKYELPRGSFGGEFFRDDFFEIFPNSGAFTSFNAGRIIGSNPDPIGGRCPIPGSTGITRCQQDFRIPSNVGLGIQFGAIDPDIKPFRQSEYTVGAEHDLGGGYLVSGRYTHKQVDEAVEDIGFSSATGSEAYVIGNPGKGLAAQVGQSFGFVPFGAVRKYDAAEIRLDKRFTQRYYFNVNYTYSRLFGNYSGLSSSDESAIGAVTPRNSPNVTRYFDLPFIGFTANGVLDTGRLPTDRPHVLKVYGAYTLDWAKQFGFGSNNSSEFSLFTTAQSGTPLTSRFTLFSINSVVLDRRGDLGRTEAYSQTDFGFRHKYRFGNDGRYTMSFDLDMLNLFNQSNVLQVYENIAPNINLSGAAIGLSSNAATAEGQFQRTNTLAAVRAAIAARGGTDLRFGLPTQFQAPRTVRFGFRLLF